MNELAVVILAAGLGKRMRSRLPKVLHPLAGKPLLFYPLRAARGLSPRRIAVVVGHGAEEVRRRFDGSDVVWALQREQLGTGHAVSSARESLGDFNGDLVILSGDVPLISVETLKEAVGRHRERRAVLTFLTAALEEPAGYGRVVRDAAGQVTEIVEERDASQAVTPIREINAGIYIAASRFLFPALQKIGNRNQQGEYYLPDIVGLAARGRQAIATLQVADEREILGINTREELALMEKTLQERINRKWMTAGVTLKDPPTTYIDEEVAIGIDTVIGPNTQLLGRTIIGEGCRIDGNAYLIDTRIGNSVHLRCSVVLTDCQVGDQAVVGPFSHLRPGTSLGRGVHIGSFVETKQATVGDGSKANHLAYLGDVTIGTDTNIGAGTITCNYDGFRKYETRIGSRVQVGSDTTLVAPVALGDDAYVATATTVRRDVPPGALVYNERHERIREGWTAAKRKKMEQAKD